MFYRKIDKTYHTNLTVRDLFRSAFDWELPQDYDTSIKNLVSVSSGKNVSGENFTPLSDGTGASDKNVMIFNLNSCAAVLFYTYNDNNKYHLTAAYHAPGGGINVETPDGDCLVIYATPILPRSGEKDYESYKNEINKLASQYGNENICIIDGFGTSSTVLANCDGELAFR